MKRRITKTIKELNKINEDIRKIIGKPKASKQPQPQKESVPHTHSIPSVA